MSVSYILLVVDVLAAGAGALSKVLVAVVLAVMGPRWERDPDIGAAALRPSPILARILLSLPVFFSWSKSGGGARCNCCNLVYCSWRAFCFLNSSWCLNSKISCRVCVCMPSCELTLSQLEELEANGGSLVLSLRLDCCGVFRRRGLPEGPRGGTDGPVGEERGERELVLGGGGGGTRLFSKSAPLSGTGGLPPSLDGYECNRRKVAVPLAGGLANVCNSSSRASSAFSGRAESFLPPEARLPLPRPGPRTSPVPLA